MQKKVTTTRAATAGAAATTTTTTVTTTFKLLDRNAHGVKKLTSYPPNFFQATFLIRLK